MYGWTFVSVVVWVRKMFALRMESVYAKIRSTEMHDHMQVSDIGADRPIQAISLAFPFSLPYYLRISILELIS